MIKRLKWQGRKSDENVCFPANVPGNIQADYAEYKNFGDVNYGGNCKKFDAVEDSSWQYTASFDAKRGEKLYFKSGGIDYVYSIFLNGEKIFEHEGMYTGVSVDISDKVITGKNTLAVNIAPPPKRRGAPKDRCEADESVKPPVGYGWDWHPRLIVSGIWNDAYLETTDFECRAAAGVSEDFKTGTVSFETDKPAKFEIYSPENECIYSGTDKTAAVKNPELWWCAGHGAQPLYMWKASFEDKTVSGRVGFKSVKLVMNEGAWDRYEPFPKSRSMPPVTICLNGKNIFAKGSNFVTPKIFMGTMTKAEYEPLVRLAKEANMNIFRVWGGSGIEKEDFYSLCDEYGIMVWQEFPLACNDYKNNGHYLEILKQEAKSIVKMLKCHASLVMWCGGNELFNSWSKMTEQSYALRLLNMVCYTEDRDTPFIMTSPLMGMAHGDYLFYDESENREVYEIIQNAQCTAYTEFGVPSVSDVEILKKIIPENELFPPKQGTSWETHHAFGAWVNGTWLCENVIEKYFGKPDTPERLAEYSQLLQCEGYKAIFEEARRQSPQCSMAINWCYNEPWVTAANNSILNYPATPKKAYFAIKNSLKPVVPSAKISKFLYTGGETFCAEIWLLNDTDITASDDITSYIEIGGNAIKVITVHLTAKGKNAKGHILQFELPDTDTETFMLRLVSEKYGENSYTLKYKKARQTAKTAAMNV